MFLLPEQPFPRNRDPDAVYANNELDLSAIDVYGFDYDYTLMNYKKSLHYLIYDLGCKKLVEQHKVVCGWGRSNTRSSLGCH